MGNCIFCGKPAGLIHTAHKECKAKNESGKNYIVTLVEAVAPRESDLASLREKILHIAGNSYITEPTMKDLLITGWERAVEHAFEDGVLSLEEESKLSNLVECFSLTKAVLDRHGAFTKVVKGAVLREILEGKIPQRLTFNGDSPFNLQKTEKLIWIFQNVPYYEQRTRREYVGGSAGMSVRIARGIYLRTSAFRGVPVDRTESVHADTGSFGVTDKHVYFSGSTKAFRIKHDKIVSIKPYSDGVGLQRDAVTAKPQSFLTGDGWFTYNLLINVGRL